jgi:hypothetical protein
MDPGAGDGWGQADGGLEIDYRNGKEALRYPVLDQGKAP